MKTVLDLIKKYSFEDIWAALINYYPKQETNKEGYILAHNIIMQLEPIIDTERFLIQEEIKLDDTSTYIIIDYTYRTEKYCLDLMPWEQIIGLSISKVTASVELVAHLLWEMTFYTWNNYAEVA